VRGQFGFRTHKVDGVEIVEIVGDLDLHTLSLIDNLLQKLRGTLRELRVTTGSYAPLPREGAGGGPT
jgi:hypothetical protein